MDGPKRKKEPTSGIKRTWGFLLVLLLAVIGIIVIINLKLVFKGTAENARLIKIGIMVFVIFISYIIFALTWSHRFAMVLFLCILLIAVGAYFFLNTKFQNPDIGKIQNMTSSAVNFINR
ncbi:MAG TPA: hypothetical protein VI564_01570 [Candidatus Nanoarchaeia archaeon]|nr:hypothetical protein [Candidatus Nanoarchaeia archaeon]